MPFTYTIGCMIGCLIHVMSIGMANVVVQNRSAYCTESIITEQVIMWKLHSGWGGEGAPEGAPFSTPASEVTFSPCQLSSRSRMLWPDLRS